LNWLDYRGLAGGAERGESFDLDLSGDLCVVDSLRPSGRRWQPPSWPGRDRRRPFGSTHAWSTAFRGIERHHPRSSPSRSQPMSIAVPLVLAVIGKIIVFLIAIGVIIGFLLAFMLFRRR
jgi:hypothetical protein